MKIKFKNIVLLVSVLCISIMFNLTSVSAAGGCKAYLNQRDCTNNNDYSCLWNETKYGRDYCNTDSLTFVGCGTASDIPSQVPELTSFTVNLLKIATPIILIIVSIIALTKAVAAANEDEIKKAQKSLVRKIIAAVLVFFIVSIVQFVVLKVADGTDEANITSCLSCFLNNKCEKNVYYKTSVGSQTTCTYISSQKEFDCGK